MMNSVAVQRLKTNVLVLMVRIVAVEMNVGPRRLGDRTSKGERDESSRESAHSTGSLWR